MDYLKYIVVISLLMFIFSTACVEPSFEVDNYNSEIVVDGWIEQGKFCQVLLTLSAPYFSEIDSISLRNYALTKAKVTIHNGEESEILTLKPNDSYFPPYLYISTRMKGEVGKTYTLTVEYNRETAFAATTIPEPVKLDSVWFALDTDQDSLGFIWVKFTDNVNEKNFYRTLTKIKNVDTRYIPNYLSNYNDDYFNGQKIEMSLYKGNKSSVENKDEFHYSLGDTITLKFCTIDKASYDFWFTFQKELMSTGNPFASTNARVKSNITNGLGVWCGYGSNYYQIIAK